MPRLKAAARPLGAAAPVLVRDIEVRQIGVHLQSDAVDDAPGAVLLVVALIWLVAI